jgi:hypothetical protein
VKCCISEEYGRNSVTGRIARQLTARARPSKAILRLGVRRELDFYIFRKMLFVTPGCHLSLSPVVVTPPCHFDRRAGKRENLMSTLLSLPVGWVPGVILRGSKEMA